MKTIYIVMVDNKIIVTHSNLEKAKEWQKATSNSILYKATLEEIPNLKEISDKVLDMYDKAFKDLAEYDKK